MAEDNKFSILMWYNEDMDKEIPGVTYVETRDQLETIIEDAIKNDDGNYLTSAQVKALIARSRERALA